MFGLSSSAGVFGTIADMLVAIYKKAGLGPLLKWVDDFFVVRLPGHSWSESDFIALTAWIGVPWSLKKTRLFAAIQRYIGFDWNLQARTVSLPQEKLTDTLGLLESWLIPTSTFSSRDAARLHGKLVHISCIFHLIRPFLRGVSDFTSSFTSPRARLHVPSSVAADLSWVQFLLQYMPNEIPLHSPEPLDLQWRGDASTSFGIGVIVSGHWAIWKWAPNFCVGPNQEHDIGWAEAVAVELGLRLALQLGLLDDPGRRFLVHECMSSGRPIFLPLRV
jgi:hypothetical protein